MSNPFSKDYKPQIDTADIARSTRQSRQTSKSRNDRLMHPDPLVREAARGTIPGLSTKDPVSDWERVKIITKPSKL